MRLLIRDVRVWPDEGHRGPVDVLVHDGLIWAIAQRVEGAGADDVVEGGGGWVLPGLHDHHLHLRAAAAARTSVAVGPGDVDGPGALARRLQAAAPGPGARTRWVRAVGYHESVAGDLDKRVLDAMCPDHPVRVQHATGALWVLNSAGLAALGLDRGAPGAPPGVERDPRGRPTGRIYREDGWLGARLAAAGEPATGEVDGGLAGLSRDAAAAGVTGFTDTTPERPQGDLDDLAGAAERGDVVQRLHLMAPAGAVAPAGALPTAGGRRARTPTPMVTLGPVKVLLDDVALPPFDQLVATVAGAHRVGRPVAVHCVTRVQAVLAVAAVRQAGAVPGDRMEHGAVLGTDLAPQIASLGMTVVTQPAMAAARGDRYLAEVPEHDRDDLWRAASLARAGVRLAAGTDAPYGPADPWAVVAAAVHRRTPSGAVLGAAERLEPGGALALLGGEASDPARLRRVRPGRVGDLCVVAPAPAPWVGPADGPPAVLATVVGGRVVWRAG